MYFQRISQSRFYVSHTWLKRGVREPPHSLAAGLQMHMLHLKALKKGNTQCQCRRNETGSLIQSNGNATMHLFWEVTGQIVSNIRCQEMNPEKIALHRKYYMCEDIHSCTTCEKLLLKSLNRKKAK